VSDLVEPIASISSIKTMHGAALRAAWNSSRTLYETGPCQTDSRRRKRKFVSERDRGKGREADRQKERERQNAERYIYTDIDGEIDR